MRLSRDLHQPSPVALAHSLTAEEYAMWAAYYEFEPMPFVEQYTSGMLCSLIANINKGKTTKTFTPEDFMPFYKSEKDTKVQTKQQISAILKQINHVGDMRDCIVC